MSSCLASRRGPSISYLPLTKLNARLAAAVRPDACSRIYAAPAINLFEKTTDRIPLKSSQHEYHVVPDRSHYLDYEPHRVLEVYAHYPGGRDKVPVRPLYSASLDDTPSRVRHCFYDPPPAATAHGRRRSAPACRRTTPARTCSFR